MAKKENNKYLSQFEEDCIWMSYRYCIGRSTIAAHMHAGEIANHIYNKLSDKRLQFMSEDINSEIHNKLHWGNFIDMGWYGNIPKQYFNPLDTVYSILSKEQIDTYEKIRSIKTINIDWNRDKQDYDYSIYYFNDDDKNKDYGRSLNDLSDLEVWQRLANLLNKENHKHCKLKDDSIVEYYEYSRHYFSDGKIIFEKVKTPIENYHNFSICKYIPEENIKEDNIMT